MTTKEEILRLLKAELPYLNERYGASRIGLFGSYSRGEAHEGSDVDLLVEFERPIGLFGFIEMEDHLVGRLGTKVELVTEDALKPPTRPGIMEDVFPTPSFIRARNFVPEIELLCKSWCWAARERPVQISSFSATC